MCKCLRVSKNGYYHWLKNKDSIVVKSPTMLLKERIKSIFLESKEIYGSYRIQRMLERENVTYSRSYISLLMKEMGLKSVLKRKFITTTDSKHVFPIAENELNRNFTSLFFISIDYSITYQVLN